MKRLALLLVGAAMGLLVAGLGEIALRLLDRPRAVTAGWTSARCDESLRRSPAAPVLLLGDSQVEGQRVPPERFLAEALSALVRHPVRVVSLCAPGWGQDQELLALRRHAAAVRPRVVVLWLTPENDLWNNTFPTHYPADGPPKPTFWLEGEALRGPHVPAGHVYARRRLWLAEALDRARGVRPYVTDAAWEARLPPAYAGPAGDPARAPSLRAYLARAYGIAPERIAYFDGENFANEKSHFALAMVPWSPRLRYAMALTHALLREIEATARAHGARLVVLTTMPTVLPDEPTVFEAGGRLVTLSAASARRVVTSVLDGLPALRLDHLPAGSAVSGTNRHLSDEANRRVMGEVARWLVATVDGL